MRAHTITTTKLALLLSLLALGALGLVACGGGDDQTTAASETETTSDELAADKKSCGAYGRWGLAVIEGDTSCRVVRRVIHDFAYNSKVDDLVASEPYLGPLALVGSWSCSGPDGHVVCKKRPRASSRIVITARFGRGRSRNEERIAKRGNEWAALFAMASPDTCRYMGQPGCEREACERVFNDPIKNCTPPSPEFRESFANATVERVVVEKPYATAEFSNGESVKFAGPKPGEQGQWFITERWIKNASRR